MRETHKQGFTLAELLICLAVLGVIALFAIPKILNSQQSQQKKAIFKEVIASLEQITYNQIAVGGDTTSTSTNLYLDNLNAVKVCKVNATTEGCYSYDTTPGALLHNGATISSLDGWSLNWGSSGCKVEGIIIDYNGDAGPNQDAIDRLPLIINATNLQCNDVPPYKIRSSAFWGASGLSLFSSLW